ncbi:MAG: hypothetical protein HKO59_10840 [Phycisphaerales bacterium]|nr:hypothetical protein [Phycisphaerae bacterium]NNM26460.1 hypothetical protein [Phycisphaerales bacterium]
MPRVVRVGARLMAGLATRGGWMLTILLAVAWLAGRGVSDRVVWSQWLRWIPTAALIGVLLLGLAAARAGPATRWRRRRTIVSVIALTVTLGHFALLEHRLLRRPPAAPDGMSLSVWHMGFRRTSDAMRTHTRTAARALFADITLLIDGHDIRGEIIDTRPDDTGSVIQGRFTLITRLPILEARTFIATDHFDVVQFRLDDGADGLVLLAVDLPSDPRLPRSELAGTLRRLLDETGVATPDIVAGDFNIPRGSHSIERVFPTLHHAYRDGGHGYASTYPRVYPLYHIDHLLLDAGWRATRYDIVDPGVGRHRAQRAWVVRAPPG